MRVRYQHINKVDYQISINSNINSFNRNDNFDYDINEYNIYNSSNWIIEPKKGNIVAILGDLTHRTLPHEGDQDRIIIGANYFLDGNIGLYKDRYSAFKIKTSSI